MTITATSPPSKLRAWLLATRPATLWAGAVPVFVGAAIARADGSGPTSSSFIALGAPVIQVVTNLVNDYADFKKGADGPERLGPPRVTSQGWLVHARSLGAALTLALSGLVGVYLSTIGGVPYRYLVS